ncbi:UBN2 domain-containing protein, partial [Cephalotus follicularis]
KTILRAYDLWEVVENGIPKAVAPLKEKTEAAESTTTTTTKSESSPTTVPMREWQKKDADALAKIHLAVSDSIFPRIMNSTSAKEAWDTLQDEFKGTVKIRAIKLQTLRRDFENLRMTEGETIKDFSSRAIEVVNQMKSYDGNITNQRVIEKILISLTEKFDYVVNIIEETRNLSELSVTELV